MRINLITSYSMKYISKHMKTSNTFRYKITPERICHSLSFWHAMFHENAFIQSHTHTLTIL